MQVAAEALSILMEDTLSSVGSYPDGMPWPREYIDHDHLSLLIQTAGPDLNCA